MNGIQEMSVPGRAGRVGRKVSLVSGGKPGHLTAGYLSRPGEPWP